MEKLENSNDKQRNKIVMEEITRFERLVKGHESLLKAIGEL